jgi:hypothetical protein
MKINKKKLIRLLCEEVSKIEEENALTSGETQSIVDRFLKKLDSIDMSLDMIYGALIDTGEPISVTRARQRAYGRLVRPRRRPAGEPEG